MKPEDFEKLLDEYGSACDDTMRGARNGSGDEYDVCMSAIRSLCAERDALQARVEAAEAILRPLYECDPAVRVWFGDPAYEPAVRLSCPPPCSSGKFCTEEVTCTPETCPHKQQGWQHTANCIKHTCAHDFQSGLWIEMDSGGTASCACGMTAMSHDMRYAP